MITLAASFWRPVQHDVLLSFAHRYVDEAVRLTAGGMLASGGLLRLTFPTVGDQALLDRCREVASETGQDPFVRATLLSGSDNLARMLRSRA
jgi:aminopeptidase N